MPQVHTEVEAKVLAHAPRILKLRGVWGFSERYQWKIVAGHTVDIVSFRVYVDKKRPKWLCRLRRCLIPEKIEGIPTDVVEMAPMVFQQDPHKQRHDILKGGLSFCHYLLTAATLGIVLLDKTTKKPKQVSNTHVIYNVDNPGGECSKIGDPQIQPGQTDGGSSVADRVGNGERYIELTGAYPGGIADAACAVTNDQRPCQVGEILHLGKIKGVKEPEIGMKLKGCCRNGDFETTIFEIAATVNVGGLGCKTGNQYAILRKQVMYAPGLGPGSSGTCMVSEDGYAVVINSFGNAGPGQGEGGGGWFKEIMDPLNLEFPEGPPPPPPPEGEFEYSLDEGQTWTKAKTMRIRGVAGQPTPASIKVKIDDKDVGVGRKVEGEIVETPD